jgi:hypothetical protein
MKITQEQIQQLNQSSSSPIQEPTKMIGIVSSPETQNLESTTVQAKSYSSELTTDLVGGTNSIPDTQTTEKVPKARFLKKKSWQEAYFTLQQHLELHHSHKKDPQEPSKQSPTHCHPDKQFLQKAFQLMQQWKESTLQQQAHLLDKETVSQLLQQTKGKRKPSMEPPLQSSTEICQRQTPSASQSKDGGPLTEEKQ